MNGAELYPGSSRSLESLRQMRLLALLRDMIDDGGKVKTAKALGVNYRTVSKAVGAVDRPHVGRIGAAPAAGGRLGCRPAAGSGRCVGGAGVCFGAGARGLEAVVGEVKAFREEHARSMRHVERRLVRLEAGRHGSVTPSPTGAEGEQGRNGGTFAQGRIPSW